MSALASGIFAGRLRDRIDGAESATRRTEALLGISTALHSAITLQGITEALGRFTRRPGELYVADANGALQSVDRSKHRYLADALVTRPENSCADGSIRAYRFSTPSGAPCIAVLDLAEGDHLSSEQDVDAVVALLSVTVERCLLLGRTAEEWVPSRKVPEGTAQRG
jgi:hypothetical protein